MTGRAHKQTLERARKLISIGEAILAGEPFENHELNAAALREEARPPVLIQPLLEAEVQRRLEIIAEDRRRIRAPVETAESFCADVRELFRTSFDMLPPEAQKTGEVEIFGLLSPEDVEIERLGGRFLMTDYWGEENEPPFRRVRFGIDRHMVMDVIGWLKVLEARLQIDSRGIGAVRKAHGELATIRAELHKLDRPGMSADELCETLDRAKIPLPPSCAWRSAGSWTQAHEQYRIAVKKWLSTNRKYHSKQAK